MNALTSVTEKLGNTLTNIVSKFSAGGVGPPQNAHAPNNLNNSMLNNSLNNSFDDSYVNYGFSSGSRGALH